MSELWLLAFIPILAWILAKIRIARAVAAAQAECQRQSEITEAVLATDTENVLGTPLTVSSISDFVSELSEGARPTSRVPSPRFSSNSSHIWDSPSGKRVYMN